MSGAQDALAVFRREIAGQEATLREQEAEIFSETRRHGELQEELEDIDSELAELEAKGKRLASEMDTLEKGIAFKNSDLIQRKEGFHTPCDRMQAIQAELETIHLSIAQSATEIKTSAKLPGTVFARSCRFESRMFGSGRRSELRDSFPDCATAQGPGLGELMRPRK